ncbi:MAG: ribonuclease P protein component [Patescibacteria group bacterium]|nr:ribonuclease P protein component [Patescibacteria group bacterium]
MLARLNRLKKKKDFEKVFKQGKGSKQDFLALKFDKNNLKNSRFGFVVSAKVSKKAVIRNKIKRRLRESVRLRLDNIKKGFDIVFVTFEKIKEKDFEQINSLVEKILKKSKLLI